MVLLYIGAWALHCCNQGKDSPFGSKYIMNIPDTVVEGHEGFSEGSEEFLVFERVLLALAKANGLYPVRGQLRDQQVAGVGCIAAPGRHHSTECSQQYGMTRSA